VKVVVPYTKLHPVTKLVLESYGLNIAYRALADEYAYGRLLESIWSAGESVVIIEQDVVPWHGAVEELYQCPGLWCSCTYRIHGGYGIYHGLGCTKISSALMSLLPNLWKEPVRWDVADQRLWFAARAIRQEPHPHRPPVIHLNPREYASA
jgi:hypothetical protein